MQSHNQHNSNSSNRGYADVLIGLQYGDEGKARVVDLLAKDYDIVARFNGGANAGHSLVYNNIKLALNQVPAGIFYPDMLLYIGSGCVVNIVKLAKEIQKVEAVGINLKGRLHISSQCSIIQPHHILIDSLTGKAIGTTKNGIGPAYSDKARRMSEDRIVNVRIGALHHEPEEYFDLVKQNYIKEAQINQIEINDVDKQIQELKDSFEQIKEYIQVDTLWMQKQVQNGKKVLFEGAQSIMLDVNKGAIPFVTSSSTIASSAYCGGDLSVNYHRKVIGVAKIIMSRVGNGPFTSEFGGHESEVYCQATNDDGTPTYTQALEINNPIDQMMMSDSEFEVGKALRVLSFEYGVVSTRPRRIGKLDMVQLKYACMMNGVDELVVTKFDMLNVYAKTKLNQVPFITKYTLNNREIDFIPSSSSSYYKTVGTQENMPVFAQDITDIRHINDLPQEGKDIVDFIQNYTNCKVVGLGVGPERDQYIKID
jgi:adenylosuccinate synthase